MPNQITSQSDPIRSQIGVDIWELWNILLRGWRTVVITAVFLGGIATLYGMLQTPLYRAEGLILPPSPKDLQILTLARTGIGRTDPTEIYDIVPPKSGFISVTSVCHSELANGILGLGYVLKNEAIVGRCFIDPTGLYKNIRMVNIPFYDTHKLRPRVSLN